MFNKEKIVKKSNHLQETVGGNFINHEVSEREAQDLEEKRQSLINRVLAVWESAYRDSGLQQVKKDTSFERGIFEKIVYKDTKTIEALFSSTEDFYEAIQIYQTHNDGIKIKHNLSVDGQTQRVNGNPDRNNKEEMDDFYASINYQQNLGRERILKIDAEGHEIAMLLPLYMHEVFDHGIISTKHWKEDIQLKAVITNELFKSKFHGQLSKLEATIGVTKQNLTKSIIEIYSSFFKKSETSAKELVDTIEL
jgi:hypothetical protein